MRTNQCLIHLVCLSLLIVLTYAFQHEYDDIDDGRTANRVYDFDGVFRKEGSRLTDVLKYEKDSEGHYIEYPSIEKFLLEPPKDLYKNSSACSSDLEYTMQNLMKPWSLKMLDSYGKPPSGILRGNIKWMGDYTECTEVYAPPSLNSAAGNFRGKYCTLSWTLNVANFSFSATSGVCIPSSCSPAEIHNGPAPMPIFAPEGDNVSNETNPILKIIDFACKPTERSLNSGAKAIIALMSIFVILTVLGSSITAFKYFKTAFQEASLSVNSTESIPMDSRSVSLKNANSETALNKCLTFLDCFCVFKNGAKILNTQTGEGELLCMHGIRFLSMSWVILGHTYVFSVSEISNFIELLNVINDFAFQIILQGGYSVDSFFVLSGFLLTYLAMQEFAKKKGEISWLQFYIHRYIRLTPVYMLLLGFSATVYFYLGSGPFWPSGDYDPICKDNWWRNLLYINNFADMSKQCMPWSWYLANDMQFFIISPLFLITLRRWPKIGYSLIGGFLCAAILTIFIITFHYDLPSGNLILFNFNNNMDWKTMQNRANDAFTKLYIKPYARIGPYLIGILVGYLVFIRKTTNKPKHGWVFLCCGWIVAASVTLACIYGPFKATPPVAVRSIYNSLYRTAFGTGLAWVIYVCLVGQGGFVNDILSCKMFIPLSRLTYVVYLIHPMIMIGHIATLKTPMYLMHPTLVYLFLGFLVTSYAVALPVALVLESPVICLEKLVRTSFAKKTESTN